MRSLFDVNVLIAHHDARHVHHRTTLAWWGREGASGWASCPLSQNGFVRVFSQPSYPARMTLGAALSVLEDTISATDHAFWPDTVSITDGALIDHRHLLGPNQITDVYLLALAVNNGGRLVTFDRTVPIAAVRGARAENLVVL